MVPMLVVGLGSASGLDWTRAISGALDMSSVALTGVQVGTGVGELWAIAAVPLLAAAVLGLRLFPQIWGGIKSLVARR